MEKEIKILRNPILFKEPTKCPFCKSPLILVQLTPIEGAKEGEELISSSFLNCHICNRTFKDDSFYFGSKVYHGLDRDSIKEIFNKKLELTKATKIEVKNPLYLK